MVAVAVDPNHSDLKLLVRFLRLVFPGCQVVMFTDPEAAAAYIRDNPIDLTGGKVLSDELKATGLVWENNTLIFNNSITINSTAATALKLPADATINVPTGVTVTITNNNSTTSPNYNRTCEAEGDLTIEGGGTIRFEADGKGEFDHTMFVSDNLNIGTGTQVKGTGFVIAFGSYFMTIW